MKRKRQTVIYILIIAFGLLFMFFKSRLFLSPESFLAANERGLHYGPSDKIIFEEEYSNGDLIIIGKIGDRALSIGEGKRKLLFFWSMPGGGFTGYREIGKEKEILVEFVDRQRLFVGLTDNEDIKEIEADIYCENEMFATERVEVGDDGFFTFYVDDGIYDEIEEKFGRDEYVYLYAPEVRGFDKDGNLISEN